MIWTKAFFCLVSRTLEAVGVEAAAVLCLSLEALPFAGRLGPPGSELTNLGSLMALPESSSIDGVLWSLRSPCVSWGRGYRGRACFAVLEHQENDVQIDLLT